MTQEQLLTDLRERMVRIETMLTCQQAERAEFKEALQLAREARLATKEHDKEIAALQDSINWFHRTAITVTIPAFVTLISSLILSLIPLL